MNRTKILLAALIGSALTTPAMAQTAPTERSQAPVSLDLARQIAGNPVDRRPLAKLRRPLCLVVAAEDQDFGFTIATRMLDNARAAGVPIGRPGCKANTLVSFAKDPVAQMQAVREGGRKLFRRMSEEEIDAALAARDPAYVFQAVQTTPRIGQGDAPSGLDDAGSTWTKERSALRAPEDLLTAMVVFDYSAVAAMNPVQVADYATLRLLAPTGEFAGDSAKASGTILSLFAAPAEAPAGLTATDRAYLQSLYTMPRTAFAEEVLAETVKIAAR